MPIRFTAVITPVTVRIAPPTSGNACLFISRCLFFSSRSWRRNALLALRLCFGVIFASTESGIAVGIPFATLSAIAGFGVLGLSAAGAIAARRNLDLLYNCSKFNSPLIVLVCVFDSVLPRLLASNEEASQLYCVV